MLTMPQLQKNKCDRDDISPCWLDGCGDARIWYTAYYSMYSLVFLEHRHSFPAYPAPLPPSCVSNQSPVNRWCEQPNPANGICPLHDRFVGLPWRLFVHRNGCLSVCLSVCLSSKRCSVKLIRLHPLHLNSPRRVPGGHNLFSWL